MSQYLESVIKYDWKRVVHDVHIQTVSMEVHNNVVLIYHGEFHNGNELCCIALHPIALLKWRHTEILEAVTYPRHQWIPGQK